MSELYDMYKSYELTLFYDLCYHNPWFIVLINML